MIEIHRTTDPTEVAYLQAQLSEQGINCFVMDVHISVLEGGIGAFPRRLIVIDDEAAEAREIVAQALSVIEANRRDG